MNRSVYRYLASPYTAPTPEERNTRFERVEDCTAYWLKQGIWVYSPIVHCHAMALKYKMPTNFEFWDEFNRAMILGAEGLFVFITEGWDQSKGIDAEIKFCRMLKKPMWKVRKNIDSYSLESFN